MKTKMSDLIQKRSIKKKLTQYPITFHVNHWENKFETPEVQNDEVPDRKKVRSWKKLKQKTEKSFYVRGRVYIPFTT